MKGKKGEKEKGKLPKVEVDGKKSVCICLTDKSIKKLDELAEDNEVSRSSCLRNLLRPILGK